MIRVPGTVKYYSQKKTLYKWQPRAINNRQASSNAHLNDFDNEPFGGPKVMVTTNQVTLTDDAATSSTRARRWVVYEGG
jgi:hypothetical protein